MEKFPFLSEVFDSINEGIYILNRQGDYIYCNSAFLKMVGATRDDVLELNAFRLVPEGQVSISVAVMAFEQKKKLSVVNNVCPPKGYHFRQLATATPIFDSVGEIEYMLVEMVRLDLFKKRYQQAILDEDLDCIEVPGLGDSVGDRPETFVAESQSMRALLDMAKQVAGVDSTILISGETGTGKEVLANFIHNNSSRWESDMVVVDCASLPEHLLEAELFGYEKGAFTGANASGKRGLIEIADGGTLFLDEINSMPLALQGKLLRVLETQQVKRIGALKGKNIDFRIIAATNADLTTCIQDGAFRVDLYYRLNVMPLTIPPLRERTGDIIPLCKHFLSRAFKRYGKTKTLSPTAYQTLEHYDWPGNVRELKNFIERLVITSSDFSGEIHTIPPEMFGADANLSRLDRKPKASSLSLSQSEEKELNDIVSALYRSGGNRSLAAEQLGVSRRTLQYKLKKYRIKVNMEPQVYIGETPAAKE